MQMTMGVLRDGGIDMNDNKDVNIYDFDRVVDRRNTDCLKYDFAKERTGREDLLPLWVADMDFRLPEEILEDLKARIAHGIFGYTDPKDSYFDALNNWIEKHYGYSVARKWVTVAPTVMFALANCVNAFTEAGDKILIQQPVYYPFGEVITDNGRVLVDSPLEIVDGHYEIDFSDLEQKISDPELKLFILCNPHNPVGRVWTRQELLQIAILCVKHDVILVSDEIHCDFIYPGHEFTSALSLGTAYRDHLLVLHSPTKTFNIAGLQIANAIIPDKKLRLKYQKANAANGYSQANIIGLKALESVYTKGETWHQETLRYLKDNVDFVRDYLQEHLPKIRLIEPEGTYLLWIDFSGLGLKDDELEDLIVDKAHLWLDPGAIFGPETAQFERFNIACPRKTLEKAFEQLKEAVEELEQEDQLITGQAS